MKKMKIFLINVLEVKERTGTVKKRAEYRYPCDDID